jgi:hypothetical protein
VQLGLALPYIFNVERVLDKVTFDHDVGFSPTEQKDRWGVKTSHPPRTWRSFGRILRLVELLWWLFSLHRFQLEALLLADGHGCQHLRIR